MISMRNVVRSLQQSINLTRWTSARPVTSAAHLKQVLHDELHSIRSAGTWKEERVITTAQSPNIKVEGSDRKILNFCANNYLGLSSHPDVIEAARTALDSHGVGMSSTRFICGTQNLHKRLEEKIALFHGTEDAVLYASCYDANAGLFEVILNNDDAVFSDELNHASIIDGVRLCRAARYKYLHIDMKDLEAHLRDADDARLKLICTDGVFSMDGTVAPLAEMSKLAEQYRALIFVDDCHSTGFFGPNGRGTEEHCGLKGKVHILNSTLGKALGGASGGYTAASREVCDILRNRSRPYLFSNSLPPSLVASASKVFDILMESHELRDRLYDNTILFRNRMLEAGFQVSGAFDHPICSIMLGDAKLAADFASDMLDHGIYVIGFSFPVVPKGKARIRVQLSAAHTTDEINTAVDAFIEIGHKLRIL